MRRVLALAVVAGLLLFAACDQGGKPTVNIVSPTNGATIGFGGTIIKAIATDDNGVTKVEFFDGSSSIGVDSTATAAGDTFSVSWAGGAAGSHTLKAVATNDDGKTAEHSISVTVSAGNATHHSGEIDADETWYPAGNPHIIDGTVTVKENATLTILPGCYVQFSTGTELRCGYGSSAGSIVAVGKADSLITFTSYATSPQPGDWSEVGVYDAAMASTQFKYCKFEYAGSSAGYGTLYIYGATIKVDYCSISNSADRGVVAEGDAHFSSFTNNTITTCAKYPIRIESHYAGTLGAANVLTGNASGYDAIELQARQVEETQTWLNQGVPYFMTGTVSVAGDASPILTIAAGTTFKMGSDVEFRCGYGGKAGAISAIGTAALPITFTSDAATPGGWSEIGIYDAATSATQFTYCNISYAGGSSGYGALYVYGATPKIDNCNINQSGDYGVVVEGEGKLASFTNNTITTCAKYPVQIQANYASTLGSGNTLTGNASGYDGVEVHSDVVSETQTWRNHGVPYVLDGATGVQGSSSPELTIAPGSTVKLRSGVEFRCGYGSEPGAIIADGTTSRITFTCAATPPSPGSWDYISFYDAALASSKLVNCNIVYGGGGYGNIYVYNSKPTISGDSIGYSDSYGIYLDGDTLNLPKPATLRANNAFYSNASGDIREP